MMEAPFVQLGLEFGGGGILGVLAGYALKKFVRLLAMLAGGVLLLLAVLESEGLIAVRWGALRRYVESTSLGPELPQVVVNLIGTLPVGGGFVVGALLGFRRG